MNVKVSLGEESAKDNIADGFCVTKGFDRATNYQGRLVVASSGYARFASIRCEKIAANAAGPNVIAAQ